MVLDSLMKQLRVPIRAPAKYFAALLASISLLSACQKQIAGSGDTEEAIATVALTDATANQPVSNETELFARQDLGQGISIEVPKHWQPLSADQRTNLAAAGVASYEEVGLGQASGTPATFAMNATPAPTGAMIRLVVTSPAEITETLFREVIKEGLKGEMAKEFDSKAAELLPKVASGGNSQILKVFPTQIVQVSNKPAILFSYQRTSAVDGSPWFVRQYHIAVGDRTVLLTVSNRLSDEAVWTPILNRTVKTIALD
jgi:hypothetical protein